MTPDPGARMLGSIAAVSAPPADKTVVNVPFTILNIASTVAALLLSFFYHSTSSVIAFLCVYTVCGLGLTMGYHRLFAHHAYTVPKPLEHLIAWCGYLAIQRGPIFWVAMHRLHHKHVDVPHKDPHTPKEGFWHVHFGWIQNRRQDVWQPEIYRRWTPDLVHDPLYLWMDDEKHDYLVSVCLLVMSFLLGGVIGASPAGFNFQNGICFLAWCGLLNRVALLHAFGLINSVCHMIGTRPFRTTQTDESTNNFFVALVIFGEGWHNNHHAFPTSARQGFRWYQLDVAWYVILFLQRAGLATNVRVPSPEAISRKIRDLQTSV